MEIEYLSTKGSWREVANSARTTVNMDKGEGEPSSEWKSKMLKAEHSPIRTMQIKWKWIDIPYYVAMHFRTHWLGIEQFISTQRSDRTGEDRSEKSQTAPVIHECEANLQQIINISKKRLCNQADNNTQRYWRSFLNEVVKPNEPELYNVCVPECVYRGHCPELESCGYTEEREYVIQKEYYQNQLNKTPIKEIEFV